MGGIERSLPRRRGGALAAAGVLIAAIALVDWRVEPNVSLGFLYLVPLLWLARVLRPWELGPAAVVCAVLRELFSPWALTSGSAGRIGVVSGVFFWVALAFSELVRSKQVIAEQMERIANAERSRREAEEQLRVLIETSPVAILTLTGAGTVLSANEAAHRLLGVEEGRRLEGEYVGRFLPVLARAAEFAARGKHFRTALEERGRRRNGEVFLAQVWFSTFHAASGLRIAAIVIDASAELRDREHLSLETALATSHVLMGAVSHEIRNLAGAAQAACANLRRLPGLASSEDLKALSALMDGLHKIASADLRRAFQAEPAAELRAVLEDLRIVIEPSFREDGIDVRWEIAGAETRVRGDHHALLQVFLNLAQNSRRALEEAADKRLVISASSQNGRVVVRFQDSGPGVKRPEALFRPFPDAAGHGLGLSVSRAMVRSFGGDLRYEPAEAGACFAIELATAPAGEPNGQEI